MTSRQAACEVCRKAKLACDHKRPVCTRCLNTDKGGLCSYRESPFKRKQPRFLPASRIETRRTRSSRPELAAFPSVPCGKPTRQPYPNPGFMGYSSHTTIFNHIATNEDAAESAGSPIQIHEGSDLEEDDLIPRGGLLVSRILAKCDVDAMRDLILFWLAKEVNLALAGPFVRRCADSVAHFAKHARTIIKESEQDALARVLFHNSAQPLDPSRGFHVDNYIDQFAEDNTRWETLGLFFIAVARATFDIPFFPSLYRDNRQLLRVRKLVSGLCDSCMDFCLSLSRINDLQLVLQYENFILHSYVDGLHCYEYWKRLGDVISCLYALGYDQRIESGPDTPEFVAELRRTAFARIYSADKNVALFLGRPPRISKRFCNFQSPMDPKQIDPSWMPNTTSPCCEWDLEARISYRAETRWSALCAFQKEELIELLFNKKVLDFDTRLSRIKEREAAHWEALPASFRYEGSLKDYPQSPFERDFVASIRLNHLHILFLVRLLHLDRLAEPDEPIVEIAKEMTNLIVEVILFREQLANSGTSLIWKITCYGLPAIGILLMSLIRQHRTGTNSWATQTHTLRNLSVFVAEIELGTIIRPGDPNYKLLIKATRIIRGFLDSPNSGDGQLYDKLGLSSSALDSIEFDPHIGIDTLDFEFGFWQDIADLTSFRDIVP
ncbi:unnamed protein product [Clonostachys rosea f. rosea IK726]|uniref:Zn(2)-C6 fungal-type domain-containing protein n=2 Tax=Bionectria ochroleuca TaxID=29856 RepID=A0A0B7KCM9_BIOOC|nr:unnamed protein product [Clonostachys rosea f. rosea IK726]